jgi:hypothetical protein
MTSEAEKWLPVAQQMLDRWGVRHESLKATIAAEIAGIVAETREECARVCDAYPSLWDQDIYAAQSVRRVAASEIAFSIRARAAASEPPDSGAAVNTK